MKASSLLVIVDLLPLIGCEQPPSQTKSQPQQPIRSAHTRSIHRFQNVSPTGSWGLPWIPSRGNDAKRRIRTTKGPQNVSI